MSAIRLREAAVVLREVTAAATAPDEMHPYGDKTLPVTPIERWGDEMRGYLGGTWGEFAALMTPPVALALADWLDAEYVTQAEMVPLSEVINASFTAVSGVEAGVLQFGRDPGGNIVFQANTFVGALAVANAILGTPA